MSKYSSLFKIHRDASLNSKDSGVRAGFVWKVEDYRYSSPKDYYTEGEGFLKITR